MAANVDQLTAEAPCTMPQMFKNTVDKYPGHTALRWEEDGDWRELTYSQYYTECVWVAKAFIKLGLETSHGVAILGFNRPEWVISYNAAIFAGGFAVGMYTTYITGACSPTANTELGGCLFVLENSKSNIVIVENQEQLDLILTVCGKYELSHLKAIVLYNGEPNGSHDNVYSWQELLHMGRTVDDDHVMSDRLALISPEQCAAVIYTSGSTGVSKGVMLSNDNLTWTAKMMHSTFSKLGFGCDQFFSYTSLSHIGAQNAAIHLPIYCGGTVNFADSTNPDKLYDTLREIQPTYFVSSPRGWEKFKEYAESSFQCHSAVWKYLVDWARDKAIRGYRNIQNGLPVPWGWTLATQSILSKVSEALGLSRAKYIISGGNPIDTPILEFFMSIGIPVIESYGMTETSGPQTTNLIGQWKLGSVGRPFLGTRIKIDSPNKNGEGEICMRGRNICLGYLANEEQTRKVFDKDGWLHSWDTGKITQDGYLFVTGRMCDQIMDSSGCAVAPFPIEQRIRNKLPFLSNVVVVGENRSFFGCLVTIKCTVDQLSGASLDEIHPQAKIMLQELGCHAATLSEILENENYRSVVFDAISNGLDRANEEALVPNQKVLKVEVLPNDFSVYGGEFGPSLKLRRKNVHSKYSRHIELLYEESDLLL